MVLAIGFIKGVRLTKVNVKNSLLRVSGLLDIILNLFCQILDSLGIKVD